MNRVVVDVTLSTAHDISHIAKADDAKVIAVP